MVLAGCDRDLPGKPQLANEPVPADQITDFTALYGMYCAGCHGADGRLGPAPPLNDAIFLTIVPDAELLRLVDEGRPGTPMPAFSRQRGGPLTDKQVRAVAEGIKPHWIASASDRKELAKLSVDLPGYTFVAADGAAAKDAAANDDADAIGRGQKLFAAACAECHGKEGAGDGAGRLNDPDFLLLASDQMLRRIIITGRPDLGMPDFATVDGRGESFRPLTSSEIDDLVALLASWRGGKTGAVAGGPAHDRAFLTEARP
ncbi:MAG TPA: c-type cytochrome [Pirellulales bacterium]|nr:c-type cytochrome [Pirellulales bacterium]